jgi:regulator of nucleoside diphosphate kinase
MKEREIFVTENDLRRLTEVFRVTPALTGRNRQHYESLQEELDRARIVAPKDIPENVVTMNSLVRLKDLDTDEEKTYRLVFPEKADLSERAISVLAPIGTAMLGQREGDTVEWEVPAGTKRLLILEVAYQPERLGNYGL